MKVYIAKQGRYEGESVVGVFDSPERAMAILPGTHWVKTTWTHYYGFPDRTNVSHWVTWRNELDWGAAACVTEHDLVTEGPLRVPDEKVIQTYRESDGKWDYLPELSHGEGSFSKNRKV